MKIEQLKKLTDIMMEDIQDVPYSHETRNAVIMKMADIVAELVIREMGREQDNDN